MQIKKITIPESIILSFIFIKNKKFLGIKGNSAVKYILIGKNVNLSKENNTILSKIENEDEKSLIQFNQLNEIIINNIRTCNAIYKKRLILKGLGFRITIFNKSKKIQFKIGFSHLISLTIPKGIKIKKKKKKNFLKIEGPDKVLLGNFVNKIKNLRKPDSYKGKGFWSKYEKEKLKEIKKK